MKAIHTKLDKKEVRMNATPISRAETQQLENQSPKLTWSVDVIEEKGKSITVAFPKPSDS